jgi:hypothetical protein
MPETGNGRVRHDLRLVVVGWSSTNPREPAQPIPGRLVALEDGRWRLFIDGADPISGDEHPGGREAAALLLRLLTDPARRGA